MIPRVTILLLDDEPILRHATSLMLSRRGGEVSAAATADEAVAMAGERLYDVAILDAERGPSPADILERMRAGGLVPRRVIAVTAGPLEQREAPDFAEVLRKPYPFDQLLRAVFGAPGRRRRTRSGVFPRARVSAERRSRACRG
jgi:CheY-like chemotaxis protein